MFEPFTSRHLKWLRDRVPFGSLEEDLRSKTVPWHKQSVWYFFGGLSLFFFVIQVVTGLLLLVYYQPTPETAFESVEFLQNNVRHGWLVRSLHSWSSHGLIVSVLVHLWSVFMMRAYRKPRELMWMTGMAQLFIVLGLGFTGFLLPWDSTAYFATQIGTEIPRSTPIVGEIVTGLLRGGDSVGAAALTRFFALHVVLFPLLMVGLILGHLVLNHGYGTSVPRKYESVTGRIMYFPSFFYREMLVWTGALAALTTVSVLLPVDLGIKSDPLASAPTGIKPDWYFVPLYQTLRMLPGELLGINAEVLINTLVAMGSLAVFCLPFLDRGDRSGNVLRVAGLAFLLYCLIAVWLGYTT